MHARPKPKNEEQRPSGIAQKAANSTLTINRSEVRNVAEHVRKSASLTFKRKSEARAIAEHRKLSFSPCVQQQLSTTGGETMEPEEEPDASASTRQRRGPPPPLQPRTSEGLAAERHERESLAADAGSSKTVKAAVSKLTSGQQKLHRDVKELARAFSSFQQQFAFHDAERCVATFRNDTEENVWVYSYNRAFLGPSSARGGKSSRDASINGGDFHARAMLRPGERERVVAFDGQSRDCENFVVWMKTDQSWWKRTTRWQYNVKHEGSYALKQDWKKEGARKI